MIYALLLRRNTTELEQKSGLPPDLSTTKGAFVDSGVELCIKSMIGMWTVLLLRLGRLGNRVKELPSRWSGGLSALTVTILGSFLLYAVAVGQRLYKTVTEVGRGSPTKTCFLSPSDFSQRTKYLILPIPGLNDPDRPIIFSSHTIPFAHIFDFVST